jgi:hypothetical protein
VYFFDVLECARRLLLTGMMVFFLSGTAAQVLG